MSKVINIPCDSVVRSELSSMVYKRWEEAFQKMQTIKKLTWEATNKFCPKNEWPLYYNSMLEAADKELQTAAMLKATICPYSPLIVGE